MNIIVVVDNHPNLFFGVMQKIINGMVRVGHNAICYHSNLVRDCAKGLISSGNASLNRDFYQTCIATQPQLIVLCDDQVITNATLKKVKKSVTGVKLACLKAKSQGVFDAIFSRQVHGNGNYLPIPVDSSIERYRAFEHSKQLRGLHCPDDDNQQIYTHLKNNLPLTIKLNNNNSYSDIANSTMAISFDAEQIACSMGNGLLTYTNTDDALIGLFIRDQELIYYTCKEELVDKINYYSRPDKAGVRQYIARSGWEKYHKWFNNSKIARYILDLAFNNNNGSKYEFVEKMAML